MNRWSRSFAGVLVGASLTLLAFELPAMAAELALKAPASKTIYDWTGFYLGGHVGYGGGSFGPGTNPLPEQAVLFPHSITGVIGGYQAGYLRQLSNHLVVGIEADASFTGPLDVPALIPAPFHTTIDYVGTVRGRAGYASGTLLAYVTGGFAWGHSHININDAAGAVVSSPGQNQLGWTVGAGIEFAVSGNWSAKLEYDYVDLARRTYDLSGFGLPPVNVD
ncbi:MAG: outer membrane protein, partial [Bradyrhizobium sp.]